MPVLADFGAVATLFHTAPAAMVIFTGVLKQPGAGWRVTFAHLQAVL